MYKVQCLAQMILASVLYLSITFVFFTLKAFLSSLNRSIKKHRLSNRCNAASMLAVVVAHKNDARRLYTCLFAVPLPMRTW